jgi:deazaflavin-dependent oxidoreductase (nitroreductase family)
MAKTLRSSLFFRVGNKITTFLLRAGVNMGATTLLTVRGRKSGQPRTTPVTIIERNGQRWITAPFGAVDWVRNLRAAREATITHGRRTETISVTELTPREAALVLKENLGRFPSFIQKNYGVTPTSSLEDFELDAPHHPVFLVKSLSGQQNASKNAPAENFSTL